MKKYSKGLFLIIFVITSLLQSCTDYMDYGEEGPEFTELGSMIIGSEGGTVSFEGIAIDIQKGTFSSNEEIKVLVDKSGEYVDNQGLTPLFRIEGFPADMSKSVTIRLNLNGSVEGTPLAGLGRKGWVVSQQTFDHPLLPVKGLVDGNQMLIELSENGTLGSKQKLETLGFNLTNNLNLGFTLAALQSKEQQTTEAGHFLITNDLNQSKQIQKLEQYLEAAYDTCINMGFDLTGRKWPLPVSITTIKDAFGQYNSFFLDPLETDKDIRDCFNDGFIQFSKEILTNDQELRATVIHEFFHLVQNLYEFSSPDMEPEQQWLQEALSVWIEGKLVEKQQYVSSVLADRPANMLEGWQKTGTSADIADHGYGLAPLIDRIAAEYTNKAILHILEAVKAGQIPGSVTDPVDALIGVIDKPIPVFWHSAISDYLDGTIYGGTLSKAVLSNEKNMEAVLRIANENDFNQTHNLQVKDLSAKLLRIDIEDNQLDDIPSLSFQINDAQNCGLTALKFTGQSVQTIGTSSAGSGTLVISGIKNLFSNGNQLFILVSNGSAEDNFEGSRTVSLSMSVPETNGWEFAYQCDFYGLTSFNGGDIMASLITFQNVAHPVIVQGDGADFYSEFAFDNGTIFLDVIAEGSIEFSVDDEGIHKLSVHMAWQKATGDIRQSETFTIDFVPQTAVDGKLRTYTRSGYNLFSNKTYEQSQNGGSVLRYEGPDPSTDPDDWMNERILVYLREVH